MRIISSVSNQGWGISMAFAADSALAPSIVNSSVERTREYLTANEVEKLMVTARKSSRYAAYRPPCTKVAGGRARVSQIGRLRQADPKKRET
jgi:hypothetical protein